MILLSGQGHRGGPVETFTKLFGSLLTFVYHCFDRIVILGHLPLLTRPENIVHFFRDVHGVSMISKDVLRQRTSEYNRWVDAFARKQRIPMEWAQKGVRKEDYVRAYLQRMERQNRFGVYFILKSMEVGPTFRSTTPRYPVDDPNYRIIARQRCRYTHYYFYIRDETLGPMAMCVGSFLPFQITYYLNGHHYIERELLRRQVSFRKNDNAFLAVADPAALQSAADRLSADIIRKRPRLLGPGSRAEVFQSRSRGDPSEAPLFRSAGGVLPESRLSTQLPHPQIIRALL
jgi:hypothetical protein